METTNGRQAKNTHRRNFRTPQNVGAEAFGGRESSKILGRQAVRLPSFTQRLLGTFGQAGQAKANMNE